MQRVSQQAAASVEKYKQWYKLKGVSVRANVPPPASVFGKATDTLYSTAKPVKANGKFD